MRDLLSKSHKLYRGVIFQPMYLVGSLTLNPLRHRSVKMFDFLIITIPLFTCLGADAVRPTLEELTRG